MSLDQAELKRQLTYDPITGLFVWNISAKGGKSIGKQAGGRHGTGYIYIGLNKRRYGAHQLAWLYIYGEFPKRDIDHLNGIRDDNRIDNLRECSRQDNVQNTREAYSHNKSCNSLGVTKRKDNGMYAARIRVNNKLIHLGQFPTEQEASAAYWEAKAEYHSIPQLSRVTSV